MTKIWTIFLLVICSIGAAQAQNQSLEYLLIEYGSWSLNQSGPEKKQKLERIIQLSEAKQDPDTEANALRRLGNLYSNEGFLDSALTCYLEALKLQKITQNKPGLASTYNNLSGLYHKIKLFEKAIGSYQETAELAEELVTEDEEGYAILAGSAHINLAQLYFEVDSIDASIRHIAKARAILKRYQLPEEGHLSNLEGLIWKEEGKLREALQAFQLAEDQFVLSEDPKGVAQSIHNQALSYAALGDPVSAEKHFEKAMDSAMEAQAPFLIAEIAESMWHFYLDQGDSLKALHFIALSKRFTDSLLNEAGIRALVEAEQKYANEAKTKEIKAQKQVLKQRYYLVIALLGVLLALVALFFVYRRFILQKQKLTEAKIREQSLRIDELFSKQELRSLNAQMTGQNEERQRISRELHDRLGSLLSTIKLQFSHYEGKLSALESEFRSTYSGMLGMLDKAYDEVRRISHDLSSGTLEKFGLKSAIDELVHAITEVNPIHIRFIDNKTDPELYESINEPLYRIIQELLSNALKHAKAKEVTLQIRIKDGIFYFSYEDDGIGMDTSTLEHVRGIGMQNINSRVAMLNGTISLDSTPGYGLTLMIEIPL